MKHQPTQPMTMTDIAVLMVCLTIVMIIMLFGAKIVNKSGRHHNENDSKYTIRK